MYLLKIQITSLLVICNDKTFMNMNTIDLTKLSKEKLIKMWETANSTIAISITKTPKEEMNEYIDWLESNPFDDELMNTIAYELGTMMCSIYVHGIHWYEYDENDNYIKRTFEVDKENPNTKELFDFCLKGFKDDIEYLKELGITKKKPTKKYPYSFNDINWSIFNKF